MTAPAQTALDVIPVSGRIGAEIHGVTLTADLPPDTITAILDALHQHKVIFFRGQHHLDDTGQEAFARLLGHPVSHPTVPSADDRYVLELDSTKGGRADHWHTDVTFVPAYPKASILRAVTVPERGGHTIWSNTAAAYNTLPAPIRELADKLHAVHTNAYDYATRLAERPDLTTEAAKLHYETFASTTYKTEHPVVRVHPETGERSLLLGGFVQRITGLPANDSQLILELLQSYVEKPENQVRWHWQTGDVAIWDNRSTQHYAVNDYDDQPRIVHRITLDGDIPTGIDGTHSHLLEPADPPAIAGIIPAEQLTHAHTGGAA
jgi:taurine dioxygenase